MAAPALNTVALPSRGLAPLAPAPFHAVNNGVVRRTLIVVPWIVMLYVFAKLWNLLPAHGESGERGDSWFVGSANLPVQSNAGSVVIDASGFLAVALSLLAFQGLLLLLPASFTTIWERGIVQAKSGTIREAMHPVIASTETPSLRAEYRQFLDETGRLLNSRWQWATALLFGVLGGVAWRWVRQGSWDDFVATLGTLEPVFETWGFPIPLTARVMGETFLGCMIGLAAWRVGVVGWQVRKLGREFDLTPHPWHPDRCGGLKPVGALCLWSALVIAPAGVHLGGWISLAWLLPPGPIAERAQFWVKPYSLYLIVPIVLALLSFVWPLWSVHRSMAAKSAEVPIRLGRLDQIIHEGERVLLETAHTVDSDVAANTSKSLDFMRATYQRNEDYPTWPVNRQVVSRFALSQAIPILTLFQVGPLVSGLVTILVQFFSNL